jgi:chromosome segregation ATPase
VDAVQQEFEKICEEHNIAARLNELDHASGSVAELQDQVAQVAPEDQMREVRMKIKARERDELQALLQKSEQECAEVQKRLDGHRSQVALMEKSINGATQHLEKAAMAAHKWLEQPDPVH